MGDSLDDAGAGFFSLEQEDRYCPCNGDCHYGTDNPCSLDCFAHHEEMVRNDDGWEHALRRPNGECREDCPHPSHVGSRPEQGPIAKGREHPGCPYLAANVNLDIEGDAAEVWFCNKCGWSSDLGAFGSPQGSTDG